MLTLSVVACIGCGQHSATPNLSPEASARSFDKYLPSNSDVQPSDFQQANPSVVPFGTRIPAGTQIIIRLSEPLSSATAHPEDTFEGVLNESVTLDGQTLLERGTLVRGKVVESASKRATHAPGYLRLILTEIAIDGHPRSVRTYTAFFKGAGTTRRSVMTSFPGERLVADTAVLDRTSRPADAVDAEGIDFTQTPKPADVHLSVNRRMTFHLLEPVSLSVQ